MARTDIRLRSSRASSAALPPHSCQVLMCSLASRRKYCFMNSDFIVSAGPAVRVCTTNHFSICGPHLRTTPRGTKRGRQRRQGKPCGGSGGGICGWRGKRAGRAGAEKAAASRCAGKLVGAPHRQRCPAMKRSDSATQPFSDGLCQTFYPAVAVHSGAGRRVIWAAISPGAVGLLGLSGKRQRAGCGERAGWRTPA